MAFSNRRTHVVLVRDFCQSTRAVGLLFGYEPDLEIQQLISESLGEYSTITVVDLDDIYD